MALSRLSERLPGIWLLSVLVAVPLAIAPGLSFYFDVTPKVVILLLGTAGCLFLWNGWLPGLGSILSHARGRFFLVLLAAQLLSLAISTFFSSRPELSLAGSEWRRFGAVTHGALLVFTLALAGWVALGGNRMRMILRTTSAAGALVALYGILQYFAVDPFLPADTYHVGGPGWGIVRPPGTLGHAGYFSIYLLHVVFFALAAAKSDPAPRWRKFGAAAAALATTAVVLSGTRSALLGLLAGTAFLWFWRRPRLSYRHALAVVGLALAFGSFYYSPPGQKLRSRADWSSEDVWGGARPWLWRDSLVMGANHWLAGTGPETFAGEFPRYQSFGLARRYPNRYYESAHNIYLDAFTSQGIAGLLILLLLTGLAAACIRPAARRRAEAAYLAAAFLAGLLANQFFCWTVPTALYFYATVALLVTATGGQAPDRRSPHRSWAYYAAVVPAAVFLLVFAFRLWDADRRMVKVRELSAQLSPRQAAEAYREVLEVKLDGVSFDLSYSRMMADAAQKTKGPESAVAWREAITAALRAVSNSDTPHNAYYNLAAFHALRNDFVRTEAALRAAIATAPRWYKSRWMLAEVLHEAGRHEEAAAEAARAVELNGGKDPEVIETWKRLRAARPKHRADQ